MSETTPTRRRFIASSAVAATGAATLGFPMIATAQPVTLRFQSTWPQKDIFHEYALDFANKVNEMSGGKLKIDVLPAGAVVNWYGKNSAMALWGSGPAFGMDPNMVLSWHYYGGGKQLMDEIYKNLNMNVVSFLYGPMATQPLGWFKKPITKAEDLKGLKFRTVGLSIDIFQKMGCAVNALAG